MSWSRKYILELKSDDTMARMIETNSEYQYRIRVLNRGEQLFYHDTKNDRATIIEIQVRNGVVFKKSISKWDADEKITEEEKCVILERIMRYFLEYQNKKGHIR